MSNKPNSNNYNPSAAYLRGLLDKASLTQREAARIIGVSERMMRYYLSPENNRDHLNAPYLVQYALEQLAAAAKPPQLTIIAGGKKQPPAPRRR